eukprot:3592453-Rhodomonas_salina.2
MGHPVQHGAPNVSLFVPPVSCQGESHSEELEGFIRGQFRKRGSQVSDAVRFQWHTSPEIIGGDLRLLHMNMDASPGAERSHTIH